MQPDRPNRARPTFLPWDDAPDAILAAARDALADAPRVVIGVTGPVGAGKSSLARRLSGCIVRTDDFLPDYAAVPYHERDDPRHADLPALAAALIELRAGRPATIPSWSFATHRAESSQRIEPDTIIVCEGIHALHEPAAAHMDLRIYVEASAETRWRRWEAIERSGQRGWTVDEARRFFRIVAEPAFAAHAAAHRAEAHFIVVNDA